MGWNIRSNPKAWSGEEERAGGREGFVAVTHATWTHLVGYWKQFSCQMEFRSSQMNSEQ
jgi:hypothetical protein